MDKATVGRRTFLIQTALAGTAGIAAAASIGEPGARSRTLHGIEPWEEGQADAPSAVIGSDFRFFTPDERAFIEAAVSRLIPNDETGPGAVEAGVPFFLDRQLSGPFGAAITSIWPAPGKRACPNRATRAASPRRNCTARR